MDSSDQHLRTTLDFEKGMKAIIRILPLVLLAACAEEFVPDNPLDPENPEYIPPIVTITSGPVQGEVVNTSAITFTWEGNETAMLFRYKFDDKNWSGWLSIMIQTFDYLNEGDHQFRVKSKYPTGDTSSLVEVTFVVDAVNGPALMFYPIRHITTQGSVVTFKILAEEVVNLTATEITIDFDPSALQVTSVTQGTMFKEISESLFFEDVNNQQGTISISSAVWGGDKPSVNGTGDLAILEFRVIQKGTTTLLFDGSEVFRDPANNSIYILETVEGYVYSQ